MGLTVYSNDTCLSCPCCTEAVCWLPSRNKTTETAFSCWASCDTWQAFLYLVPLTVANASRILSWIENWEFWNKIIKFKVLYWSLLVLPVEERLTSLNKSSFEKTSSFKIIMCGYNNEESICETMILKAGLFLDASALQWCEEMPSLTWVYCGKNISQFKCTVTPWCGKIISQCKCTTMKWKDKFLNICVLQWCGKIQLWIYKCTAMM